MVLMIGLSQSLTVLENELLDAAQLERPDASIPGKTDRRIKPELALAFGRSDMNMRRFATFIGDSAGRHSG